MSKIRHNLAAYCEFRKYSDPSIYSYVNMLKSDTGKSSYYYYYDDDHVCYLELYIETESRPIHGT